MTIAYCVVAHQRPAQTQRLVHRLLADDPACQVVLHYDQSYEPLDLSQVTLPRVRLMRERPISWGTPAIVDSFVEMLQIALAAGCSYASILSGQDYPVRAVGGLETVLSQYDVWADLRPLLTEDGSFNGDAEPRPLHLQMVVPEHPAQMAQRYRPRCSQSTGRPVLPHPATAPPGAAPATPADLVGCEKRWPRRTHLRRQRVDGPLGTRH